MNRHDRSAIDNLKLAAPTFASVLGMMVLVLPLMAAAQPPAPMKTLEGTWRIQVTIIDCVTGAEGPSFWSLTSFAHGGTLTDTTANQALPAPRTPGHGVWFWIRPGVYFAASEAFLLFGPTLAPWTQRIDQTIVMQSDDEFITEARVVFSVTPSPLPSPGTPPPPGCARARGRRL